MSFPVLEFSGISLTYPGPPPIHALRSCDLVVERGDYLTVVGPSGSGKSSFLNLAGLLDRPTGGRYLLDGLDTAVLTDRERAALRGRRIGFVFQSFHLLPHRSATENVALASLYTAGRGRHETAHRRARAWEALARVGLAHRMDSLPTHMSGGERQRVAIARALMGEPSLLLCDEPTGNLDSATAQSVLTLIEELNDNGMTVILITHDLQVAARAHRTVAIRDGVLTETVPR
ncbi:ABC transporter ATP-binding protein [Kitasatospora sp. NRRL B-11411]|uniref:ABC transporter ATP-binding protein n=1 Tax=Kitasatospora sp. NRRL B-11411 TaxID=1463822 RepID=UPI0004C2CE69|nr:ABC transporter ATP-binding protein [Kitasatospora sp. NRRL B-11411]